MAIQVKELEDGSEKRLDKNGVDSGLVMEKGAKEGKDGKEKKEGEGEEEKESIVPVGMGELFKFAKPLDKFLIFFGLSLAFWGGSAMPIMTILFGDTLQAMIEDRQAQLLNEASNGTIPLDNTKFITVIERFAWGMTLVAVGTWIISYIFVTCLNYAAARQVFHIRTEFLRSVLHQDIGWYDTNTTNDFASKMTEDLNKLQEGIGEKLGMMSFFMGTFFISIVVAFIYGWELTLVLLCMMPLLAIAGGVSAKAMASWAGTEMEAYGKAGAVAEEALGAIRTVFAFQGQKKETDRYAVNLATAQRSGMIRGSMTALSGGLVFGIMYAVYGLGFWYGIKLIMDDRTSDECIACEFDPDCLADCVRYNGQTLLVVFFSVLMGGFQIGQCAPYAEALATARGSAAKIYEIIATPPAISSASKEGAKPKLSGNIEFSNVVFNYPARKEVKILQGLSLTIPEGKTVALVGSSGCGKSTLIQLVQRFYDPDSGTVRIDGHDLKEMNVKWIRDHMGIVGQEPVLFDCSIKDNIRLGRKECTDEEIIKACKEANAWDFIQRLPKQLDTHVGEGGTQISGGQKQRIAIARALVRNPKILLLDEATSALDSESERVVQVALDAARAGRTTIIVAHRLSTVRNADMIVAISEGEVKEKGTHEDLMELKGLYFSLVTRQTGEEEDKTGDDEDTAIEDAEDKEDLPEKKLERKDSVVNKMRRQLSRRFSSAATPDKKRGVSISEDKKEEDEDVPKIPFLRLMGENRPEWLFITVGILCSVAMGALMPIFSILFGDILGVIAYPDTQKARDESVFYAWMFVLLGVGSLTVQFVQGFSFAYSGEKMTTRLRIKTFSAILSQEMGWYDLPENNTGSLCARLSGDVSKVQGATGVRVGTLCQGFSGLIIATIMGLYYSWQLGLVCTIFFPVLIGAVFAQMKIIIGVDSIEGKAFETSSKLAVEAITNIRTIAGLQCEEQYTSMYTELLREPHKMTLKRSHLRGMIFGFSQAMQFFAWGITLWYGGTLIDDGKATFEDVFKVTNAIIGGAGMIGYSFAFTGDINKAFVAAGRIYRMLDRVPLIDSGDSTGLRLGEVKGNIDLKEANFSYPTRKNTKVLNDLSLAIKAGQSIALVGESGCGKSTVIQLIQRFYDLSSGSLELEDQNIEGLNVPFVRSKMGIVSQEPVLFDRSIAENIMYGDNSRDVSMEEVLEAARKANIHTFVSALPEGYETRVGGKGTQLSGGQKQRVAIARALVRNPRILLLDEATSALDTESEGIVQEALDAAQVGRTSLTIAHRLSTIKGVDKIFVVEHGRIAESGSHAELLEQDGLYSSLWKTSTK